MNDQDNTVDRAVGHRLRELREIAGLSQDKLARKTGLDVRELESLESGASRLSATHLWQLCEIFGLRPRDFYDGVDVSSMEIRPTPRQLQEAYEVFRR